MFPRSLSHGEVFNGADQRPGIGNRPSRLLCHHRIATLRSPGGENDPPRITAEDRAESRTGIRDAALDPPSPRPPGDGRGKTLTNRAGRGRLVEPASGN
jgi:hypothetical protein